MNILFKNKKVLISGAGGCLGRALADAYCKSEIGSILLLDHPDNEEEVVRLAERCLAYGVETNYYFARFEEINAIKKTVKQIREDGHQVDILINNAGINVMDGIFEVTEEIWDYVYSVNTKGAFFLTQMIAQDSLLERKGNILFIASQHAIVGNVKRVVYCSSKSAVIGMVNALMAEWSMFGVRVNAVSPTYVINSNNRERLSSLEYKRKYLSKIPLSRYATVEDVANAVLFLTSDHAQSITGHNLLVDGGYTTI